jgi:ABC-type multidrug transport system, permease component
MKLINVALLKIRLTLKDRTAFIWMLIAPLIFVFVLNIAYGRGQGSSEVKYPISIVNNDEGSYSAKLIDMLRGDSTFSITILDYDKAKESIEGGSTSMGIVIPGGFSDSFREGKLIPIEILKLQDNETTMALSTVINNYIYQLKVGVETGDAAAAVLNSMNKIKTGEKDGVKSKVEDEVLLNLKSPKITYEASMVQARNSNQDGLSYAAIGVIVMFIMFFLTNAAGTVLEEREAGTWNRIMSTPTRNFNILGGYVLGEFLLGWVQVGLLILVSKYMFHVNWGNSTLGLIMLFSAFLLSIIGFGTALSSLVKSKAQLSSLSSIIIVPTCMLSGCFWSMEIMPDFMVKISNFIPQAWVVKGMTDLIVRGSNIGAVYLPSIILVTFAVVFFILGLTLMNALGRE